MTSVSHTVQCWYPPLETLVRPPVIGQEKNKGHESINKYLDMKNTDQGGQKPPIPPTQGGQKPPIPPKPSAKPEESVIQATEEKVQSPKLSDKSKPQGKQTTVIFSQM